MRMLRMIAFAAFAVAMVVCLAVGNMGANAQPALVAYVFCTFNQMVDLDDGKSDARTIAAAVLSNCMTEKIASIKASHNVSDDQAAAIMMRFRELDLDHLTASILEQRSTRRKQAVQKTLRHKHICDCRNTCGTGTSRISLEGGGNSVVQRRKMGEGSFRIRKPLTHSSALNF